MADHTPLSISCAQEIVAYIANHWWFELLDVEDRDGGGPITDEIVTEAARIIREHYGDD